jgi:hypothetical protein
MRRKQLTTKSIKEDESIFLRQIYSLCNKAFHHRYQQYHTDEWWTVYRAHEQLSGKGG